MENSSHKKWKSIRISNETHELLVEINQKTDISMSKYIAKAIGALWEKDKKRMEEEDD